MTEQGEIVYKQGKAILEQVNQLRRFATKQTDVKESVRLGLNVALCHAIHGTDFFLYHASSSELTFSKGILPTSKNVS